MKKRILLFMAVWLPMTAFCDKVTVHVETEGTLEEVITDQDVLKITDLTITGRLNAVDINYLRACNGRIAQLETLDLRDVTLVAGDVSYYNVPASMASGSYGYYLSEEEYEYYPYSGGFMYTRGISPKYGVFGMHLAKAFSGDGKPWKKVVLPKMVKKVGANCFEKSDVEVVEAPGAGTIDSEAFIYASSLVSFTSSEPLDSIGSGAFKMCSSLTSINLSNVETIGSSAFEGCSSLKSVNSLNNVKTIGERVFKGCSALEGNISLPALSEIPISLFEGCKRLSGISFSDNLKSIDESAFSGCTSFTSLSFPKSLEAIGVSAFDGCTSLKSLSFQKGLKKIENSAFQGCTSIPSLTLPDGLIDIGSTAFSGCSALAEVNLPSTLQDVTYDSFANTPWFENLAAEDDGMLVVGTVAVRYLIDESFAENSTLTFREGIKGIADNFTIEWRNHGSDEDKKSGNITNIRFPSTLEYIGDNAFAREGYGDVIKFSDYNGITHLSLPLSLKRIGRYAFPITIESVNFPEGLEEIGGYAFAGCSKLEEAKLPSTLKKLGRRAFANCSGLLEINIPESLEELGEKYSSYGYWDPPFYGCKGVIIARMNAKHLTEGEVGSLDGLEKIIVGSEVEVLPRELFDYSSHLKKVEFQDRPTNSKLYVDNFISGCHWPSVVFPNCKIAIIGSINSGKDAEIRVLGEIFELAERTVGHEYNFVGDIRLAEGIKEIPKEAFYGCTGITSINLPEGLQSIGDKAFYGCTCTGLTSVIIPGSVTSIGESAFSDCNSLTSVSLLDGVTSIGEGAFRSCKGLTSVTIPSSLTTIESYAFDGCSGLTRVNISDLATWCNIDFESTPQSYAHHLFLNDEEITELVIPDGVTSISSCAFYGLEGLTSVSISNTVTSIGVSAFSGCTGLTSVTIPSSLTTIERYAFRGCTGLTSITIPGSVTEIGENAFDGCNSITSIFSYLQEPIALTKNQIIPFTSRSVIYVPVGTSEKYKVTYGWINFKAYYEGDGTPPEDAIEFADEKVKNLCVTNWDANNDGFLSKPEAAAVTSLNNVFRYSSITSFDELQYFTSLTDITENEFYGCSFLTELTIPEGVVNIGDYAFRTCHRLAELTVPEGVANIGDEAFCYCESLRELTIPGSVASIGKQAFYNSGLTKVILSDGVTTIGQFAFSSCKGLTSVTIPSSVTSIGSNAFNGCSSLESVISYIKEPFKVEYIFNDAFLKEGTLYVPARTTSKYRVTNGWNFTNIVEMAGDEVLGDVTGDGNVDSGDVDTLAEIVANQDAESAAAANPYADVNGDGKVNVADIVMLINITKSKTSENKLYDDEAAPCVEDRM